MKFVNNIGTMVILYWPTIFNEKCMKTGSTIDVVGLQNVCV